MVTTSLSEGFFCWKLRMQRLCLETQKEQFPVAEAELIDNKRKVRQDGAILVGQ
jgi:hypothetical protein